MFTRFRFISAAAASLGSAVFPIKMKSVPTAAKFLVLPVHMPSSMRFNPLDEIRMGTIHEFGDARNLALMLCDPEGKSSSIYSDPKMIALSKDILKECYMANESNCKSSLGRVFPNWF